MTACRVEGCEAQELKGGEVCVRHHIEEYNRRNFCRAPGCKRKERQDGLCTVHMPAQDVLDDRQGDEEAEYMKKKRSTCAECKREIKDEERVYKGKCPDCRGSGKRPHKRRPEKSTPLDTSSSPAALAAFNRAVDDAVEKGVIAGLKGALFIKGAEIKKIYTALKTIEEVTGKDLALPTPAEIVGVTE